MSEKHDFIGVDVTRSKKDDALIMNLLRYGPDGEPRLLKRLVGKEASKMYEALTAGGIMGRRI